MKISKSWLCDWIDLSAKSASELCAALNEIGLEVDSCEHKQVPNKVVVAKVLECCDHENSDHLHVCKVDAGTGEILQIVCGAPNVAAGQFVACALEGAKIGEITIKKAKLRGVESCGMLCSARELGLGELNDGIMVLDESIGELELGKELCEFSAFNDDIIEIELTPNRGDCLSILGVARDLSTKFDLPVREISPKKSEEDAVGIGRLFSLHSDENKNSSLLYKAVEISPDYKLCLKHKLRLLSTEHKEKTDFESALAYITHSTGVLFRAYDARKIEPNEDEKFALNVATSETGESRILVNDKLLSIVGIWANKEFCVDENTKIAIIEASYTDPEIIANAIGSNKDKPKDEMTYRSSRGSEPNLGLGMNLLLSRILEKEKVYGGSQQINKEKNRQNILINCAQIGKMIGMKVDKKEIHKILARLNFELTTSGEQDEQFYAKAPAYRHDIQNIGDVCEEIVRILGIDNIAPMPLSFSEENRINATYIKHKNALKVRKSAVSAGFFECVHYVFDDPNELRALGFKECKTRILNPITNELAELKPTLLNALLNSALNNAKRGIKSIKLFEYGEVFDENGAQSSRFGFVSCGLEAMPSLQNSAKGAELTLFAFANDIQKTLGKITLKESKDLEFLSPYEQAGIYQNGVKIGFLGRLKPEIKKDLPKCYVCEIYFDKMKFNSVEATPYSDFQAIWRDLSVVVDQSVKYEQIKECINALKISELKGFYPTDLYKDKKLGQSASLTITFSFQSNEKTFTDDEINAFMDRILESLKENLGISLR